MIMMMVVMLLRVMTSSSYFFIHLPHGMEEEDSPSEEDPKKVNIWSSRGQKRPGIYSVYTGQQSEYIGSLYFHLFKIPSVLTFYC